MSQQLNKVQKKARRLKYIKRLKQRGKKKPAKKSA